MNSDSGIQPGGVGIEGRAQNIAPLQVGGIVAIDAIDAIEDGLLGMWAWWDGRDKKVGRRGCEG